MSFVLALAAFASPPAHQDGRANVSATTAKAATVTTVSDFADLKVSVVEEAVELNGRSTYALSTCPATFTPIVNTIDRFPPATPPPVS